MGIRIAIVKKDFIAKGTTCESCSKIIKKQAKKVKGVKKVEFDYSTEKGTVTFDEGETNLDEILYKIEEKGYECFLPSKNKQNKNNTFGWITGVLGVIVVGYFILKMMEGVSVPAISQNMGYGLLFLVGLLTGFHCIAMCGGFVIGYTTKHAKEGTKSHKSHITYGLGKTISYTVIGGIFGLIGSVFSFTPTLRATVGIVAGLFLVLFGLKMLNIFPILRKIQFRFPKFITKFSNKESKKHTSPLIIGLLNGLMIACGPLQAMYIMAAGTGSAIEGAKLLLIFGLGTLPVLLGFGFLASIISNKATNKILKTSGVLVIILGLIMINRGFALSGTGLDSSSLITSITSQTESNYAGIVIKDGYQIIKMDVVGSGYVPNKFVLKKDIPVKWVINGKEITGCNGAIQVPKYGLEFDIKEGIQTIEFTPTEEGVVSWSCWMGMIPGSFIVKDNIEAGDAKAIQKEIAAAPEPASAGSCGGSSTGGCGCGG